MTEIVQAECPKCRSILRFPASWLRGELRCKHCQTVFQAKATEVGSPPLVFRQPVTGVSMTPAAMAAALARPDDAGGFVPIPQVRRLPYELLFSLAAILLITIWYIFQAQEGLPKASSLIGHVLAIVGFLMMLSTQTLYSLRKHSQRFTFGRMNSWLKMHIFTGIVGSYLVLLHAGWRFNGLAGVLALVTVIVVISGFTGRFIYTAVPRNLDGVEVAVRDMEVQIAGVDRHLQALGFNNMGKAALAAATNLPPGGWRFVLGRHVMRWRLRRQLRRLLRDLPTGGRLQAGQLENLLVQRQRLLMQIHALAVTRRLLALWHVIHIPLCGVLFTLAFIHVAAALYYATLMK